MIARRKPRGRPDGVSARSETKTELDSKSRCARSSPAEHPGTKRSAGRASRTTSSVTPSPAAAHATSAAPEVLLRDYRPDLADILAAEDAPAYRYTQVYEHLFHRPLRPFSEATPLPASTRSSLDELPLSALILVDTRISPDGTTKLLFSGHDGAPLETVVMRYRDRLTVCVSSQSGCAVGCGFCATGAMGLRRNLSTAEIVDQVRVASSLEGDGHRRISNIVYMGMGEPLLNLQAVLGSIRALTAPRGLGLAHRSLSVSTVGIPQGILRLGRNEPQVNLALSLHAADDRTRTLLIPQRFRHPLAEILEAAWKHFELTHRKLMIEYVLLAGINDSVDDARQLAALLRGHVVTVNLLSWNFVPRCSAEQKQPERSGSSRRRPALVSLHASSLAATATFLDTLRAARIEVAIRRSKGVGIGAACGQLAGRSLLGAGVPAKFQN